MSIDSNRLEQMQQLVDEFKQINGRSIDLIDCLDDCIAEIRRLQEELERKDHDLERAYQAGLIGTDK